MFPPAPDVLPIPVDSPGEARLNMSDVLKVNANVLRPARTSRYKLAPYGIAIAVLHFNAWVPRVDCRQPFDGYSLAW